jgi:hypothetical protein
MKNMLITLLAIVGLSSLHQTQASVIYSNDFENQQAGNPGDFGNYNLDNTNWGWGVTGQDPNGGYLWNNFPSGGPNKGLYGLRTGQGNLANQGQNVMQFNGAYSTPANVAGGKKQMTTFYYNAGSITQGMVDQGYVSLSLNYKAMNQQDEYGFNTPSTGNFFIEVLGRHQWGYLTAEAPYGAASYFNLDPNQTDWQNDAIINLALNQGLLGKTLQFGVNLTSVDNGLGGFSNTSIAVDNIVLQTASAPITAAIPEPSIASLLGFGALGLVATRLRRRS